MTAGARSRFRNWNDLSPTHQLRGNYRWLLSSHVIASLGFDFCHWNLNMFCFDGNLFPLRLCWRPFCHQKLNDAQNQKPYSIRMVIVWELGLASSSGKFLPCIYLVWGLKIVRPRGRTEGKNVGLALCKYTLVQAYLYLKMYTHLYIYTQCV